MTPREYVLGQDPFVTKSLQQLYLVTCLLPVFLVYDLLHTAVRPNAIGTWTQRIKNTAHQIRMSARFLLFRNVVYRSVVPLDLSCNRKARPVPLVLVHNCSTIPEELTFPLEALIIPLPFVFYFLFLFIAMCVLLRV